VLGILIGQEASPVFQIPNFNEAMLAPFSKISCCEFLTLLNLAIFAGISKRKLQLVTTIGSFAPAICVNTHYHSITLQQSE